MNFVNYAVEYEYAAMGLLAVLFTLYCARKKYPGMSNQVYVGMIVCTFMSCVMHVFAIKTLPYADSLRFMSDWYAQLWGTMLYTYPTLYSTTWKRYCI